MNCPKCETPVKAEQKFCTKCGEPIILRDQQSEIVKDSADNLRAEASKTPPIHDDNTSKSRKKLYASILTIVLVLIFSGGYYIYQDNKNKEGLSESEIRKFVDEFYKYAGNWDLDKMMSLYADKVDYNNMGITEKDKILRLLKQAPIQRVEFVRRSIEIVNTDNRNVKEVVLKHDAHITEKNGIEKINRDIEVKLILMKKDKNILITYHNPVKANISSGVILSPAPTHIPSSEANYNTQMQKSVDSIRFAITEYYKAVEQKRVEDAMQMYAAERIPSIKKNLLESIAKDTEYYRIEKITVSIKDDINAHADVNLYHKKKGKPEEYWIINISMFNESGRWKIWSTPGNKVR